MFLFFVYSIHGPMSSPDMVSNFSVSQWDHTSSIVGYHNHGSTASSQRDCVSQSTLSHDNLANRCGWRSSSHSSPLSMCQVTLYSKTYHTNSCQTSRVDLCVLLCSYRASNSGRKLSARLFTQTGHECRRQCQLLQWETINR